MKPSQPSLTRRRLLQGTASLGLATVAAPAIVQAQADKTLVVNGYGGEFQTVFLREVVRPFEQKFGVKVIYDNTGTASENYAKIRATAGQPGFDIAHELTPAEIILGAKEGLLAKIDESKVPNLSHVWQPGRAIIPEYGLVHTFQYTALLYNSKSVQKPESWANYWMPETKYDKQMKGKLITYDPGANVLQIYAMMMAAKMLNGNLTDLEPVWKLLRQQKEWIGQSVQTSAQAATYFANDQVWLSPYWSGRSGLYKAEGYPIDYTLPAEGTVGLAAAAAIPVNAKNKDLAYQFLNFRLEKEIQRNFGIAYHSSPARADITDWPAAFAESLLTTEEKLSKLVLPDNAMIGRKRNEWTMRWQEIMAS